MQPRDDIERKLLDSLEELRHKVDVLEDLVSGDSERNILGLIKDLVQLREQVEMVLEHRRTLQEWNEKWENVEAFMVTWNNREMMVRGAFWLIAGSGGLSLLTFFATILGIGA